MKIYVIRRSNKRGPTKTNDVPLELRSPPTKLTKNSEEPTDDEDLIKPASDQFDNWSDTSNVDSGCETELADETAPDGDISVDNNDDNAALRLGDECAALHAQEATNGDVDTHNRV